MESESNDRIKHREILFREPHEDPQQAHTAALVLSDVDGVLAIQPDGNTRLQITYDVGKTCLQALEGLLEQLGFHLDNSLMSKLRRALYYYMEEAEQDSLGCKRGQHNCTQAIFISRYRNLKHGCRDERPAHWRRYL